MTQVEGSGTGDANNSETPAPFGAPLAPIACPKKYSMYSACTGVDSVIRSALPPGVVELGLLTEPNITAPEKSLVVETATENEPGTRSVELKVAPNDSRSVSEPSLITMD